MESNGGLLFRQNNCVETSFGWLDWVVWTYINIQTKKQAEKIREEPWGIVAFFPYYGGIENP